jgi:hypothetical protein
MIFRNVLGRTAAAGGAAEKEKPQRTHVGADAAQTFLHAEQSLVGIDPGIFVKLQKRDVTPNSTGVQVVSE